IKGVDVNLKKKKTPPLKIIQFKEAEENLNNIWDYGFQLYKSLTYKVIPVKSDGLVSYSHFSEPGISYINLLDRNLLETVDDLIHENAHHHLNLILKKHKILKKNDPEQKYYSPWRDSLRSIYAILHASFTFSFAAKLFYHILNTDPSSLKNWKMEYLETSRFRFIEETKMLTYSLDDLNRNNALFTKKGLELLEQLSNWNKENEKMARLIQKKISNKKNIEKIYSLQKKLTSATFEYKRYADIKASKK
ncbi:MAG: hypothetical protein KDK36_07310, partial [Leptospiraceae bacterium]|nr:hypothetical protein [Leptospiraceae bacterium]